MRLGLKKGGCGSGSGGRQSPDPLEGQTKTCPSAPSALQGTCSQEMLLLVLLEKLSCGDLTQLFLCCNLAG